MEREKPYLDPELTLPVLAQKAGFSRGDVSRAINSAGNENFSDFVNKYRVEHVKRFLESDKYDTCTILTLALDAGFNSKSVFNDTFKRITGKTPGSFRENRKISSRPATS